MDNIVEIIVSAFPRIEGLVDTAQVVVSAIPGYLPQVASGGGIIAILGFIYLSWADHYLWEEED